MPIVRTVGRLVALRAVQCLCAKRGSAVVLACTLALAGGASRYLDQPANPAAAGMKAGQARCGAHEQGYAAFVPEMNQFYWTCYAAAQGQQ